MEYDFDKGEFIYETQEQKEEKLFKDTYTKQLKYSKIALVITFATLTVVFTGLSLLFYFGIENPTEDDIDGMIVMEIMAGVMLLLTFIFIVIPFKVPDYKKFKKRNQIFGIYNTFDLIARIELLEKRIDELEKEIKKLK